MKKILLVILLSNNSFALSALEVANKVYNRPDGNSSWSSVTMKLEGKGREDKERTLDIMRRDDQKGNVSSLVTFHTPKRVQGIALLTVDELGENKMQMIYLPALKSSKRIAGSNKDGRFVGSEIFYEDLRDRIVSYDNHKLLSDGKFMGARDCYRLESTPVNKENSTYSKKISCIDKETFLPLEVEMYDAKNKLWKIFKVKSMKKINGIWTVMSSEMKDVITEKSTTLIINEIEYDSKKVPETFSLK